MYIQTGILLLWENQYRPQKFCILLSCNWKLTSFLTFKLSSISFWVQWVQWKLVLSNTRLLLVTCQLLLVLTSRCIKLLGPLICRLCMCLYVCIDTHTYTHTALVWSNHPAYNDIGLMMVSPCACMRVSLCVCVSARCSGGQEPYFWQSVWFPFRPVNLRVEDSRKWRMRKDGRRGKE